MAYSEVDQLETDIHVLLEQILKSGKKDVICGKYSKEELSKGKEFNFLSNLTDDEVENLSFIGEDAHIKFQKKSVDEHQYVDDLLRIFRLLQGHNRKYNISIEIENRELLVQSGLLDFSNFDLKIETLSDNQVYSKEEFLNEDAILEQHVEGIKNSNLSPYEKFLAVYNKVKQFREYEENDRDDRVSRGLRYILDKDNKYIVCVGFSELLTALLNKVGISTMSISVAANISYDDGLPKSDKPTILVGHARNLIKIDDDKYGIHGIYVSDATWDNDMENDFYNNSAMTFDRKKEAFRMEGLENVDLLLDFHNFNDFCKKINFYLKRRINKNNDSVSDDNKIIEAFESLYNEIMTFLYYLDYSKYKELYDEYNGVIESAINDYKSNKISLEDVKSFFDKFLAEYANYIMPLSNKEIGKDTMLAAITSVKRQLSDSSEEKIQEELYNVGELFDKRGDVKFPYIYNPEMDASSMPKNDDDRPRAKYEYGPGNFGINLSEDSDNMVMGRFNYLESREELPKGHSK